MHNISDYPTLAPIDLSANVRRVPSVPEMLKQQETLRGIIESISSELELRPLLTQIVRHACELLGAFDGGIGLYDPQRGVIRMEAIHNMPEDELGSEFGPGLGLAGQVLATRGVVIYQSYRQVPSPTRQDRNQFAVVGVPIAWQNRMIGVFGLGAPSPREFDAVDAEVVQLLGRHAAIAIFNAQRYQREQQRARRWAMVARIGRMATSGLALKELLQTAADEIHQSLGYTNVAIPLVDERDPSRLKIEIFGGGYRELLSGVHYLPIEQGIMGAAVRERRVQRVDDVSADPRHVPTPGTENIQAELAIPILLRDEALGVLNIEGETPFTDDDVSSLRLVADHLALAIQNSRLLILAAQSVASGQHPPTGERSVDADAVGLSPAIAIGLVTRLSELVEALETETLSIQLETADYAPSSAELEEVLFVIAEQALDNVVRHARGRNAEVRLWTDDRFAHLEVLDDGVGWPMPSASGSDPGTGSGLLNIRNWAAGLGGQVDFLNRRQRGAAVRVAIPNLRSD